MTVQITRRRPSAATVLGATILLLASALVGLSFLARRPGYPLQPLMIAIPSAAVGVLVARRQPRNPNGWLLLGIAVAILLSTGAGVYSLLVYRLGRDLPLGPLGLVLYQLWSPALALFLLVILLFPDGRLPSPRWRSAVWVFCLLCGGYLALLLGVAVDAISGHQITVDDAYGGLTVVDYPAGRFAITQDVILLLILAFGLCFAGRQLLSFRNSSGDRRQQLKWLMFGSAICVVSAGLSIPGQTASSGIWAALNNALSLGFIALPASIGVGILRYRLYDIDRLISRTLAYAIVTGLVIGVYAALVTMAHSAVSHKSPLVVAVATLAAVAVFNPLRRRVQRIVDRRFNRTGYDAEGTITAFAARMQDAADLEDVRSDLVAVACRALEPVHISVWVRDDPS
jgi:N-terminal 7TM region of histidine kinase